MNQDRLAERVAYKLIHHVCRLQAGDVALLSGRRDQLDLLLRLEFHTLAAGALAIMVIEDEARLRRLLNELPPASAANERLALVPIAQTVTHVLDLTNGPPDLRGLPQKTLQAWQDANHTLQAALRQRQRARIEVALPSRRQAQRLRQPFHPYNDAIWRALDTDYALMERRGQYLQAALSDAGARGAAENAGTQFPPAPAAKGAPLLRLSDARGAALTVRLAAGAGAARLRDDGILSPEALAEAGGYVNRLLPAGEFRVAVAEGSAEGEAIIDAGWFQGKPLRHLRLRFRAGRVVGMEGAGAPQAEAALAAAGGAPLLSKLSIGLNPAVTSLRPYPLGHEASLLAYRRAGAVFLTLGDNRAEGGTNRPALEWSLGLARPMLEVDGQVLLRGGEFVAS